MAASSSAPYGMSMDLGDDAAMVREGRAAGRRAAAKRAAPATSAAAAAAALDLCKGERPAARRARVAGGAG